MIGKHYREIVHRIKHPIPECPLQRVKKSLRRESLELQLKNSWIQIKADPIIDARGKFAGAVHIITDITEQKRSIEAIKENEDRFRNLYENSSIGFYRTTSE